MSGLLAFSNLHSGALSIPRPDMSKMCLDWKETKLSQKDLEKEGVSPHFHIMFAVKLTKGMMDQKEELIPGLVAPSRQAGADVFQKGGAYFKHTQSICFSDQLRHDLDNTNMLLAEKHASSLISFPDQTWHPQEIDLDSLQQALCSTSFAFVNGWHDIRVMGRAIKQALCNFVEVAAYQKLEEEDTLISDWLEKMKSIYYHVWTEHHEQIHQAAQEANPSQDSSTSALVPPLPDIFWSFTPLEVHVPQKNDQLTGQAQQLQVLHSVSVREEGQRVAKAMLRNFMQAFSVQLEKKTEEGEHLGMSQDHANMVEATIKVSPVCHGLDHHSQFNG
jgi:hypothetical protein